MSRPAYLERAHDTLWRIMQGNGTSHQTNAEGQIPCADLDEGECVRAIDRTAPQGKDCPRCETHKPLTDFGFDTGAPDGRHTYCRVCRSRAKNGYVPRVYAERGRSCLPKKPAGTCLIAACTARAVTHLCAEHEEYFNQDKPTRRVAARAAAKSFARLRFEEA